MALLAIAKEALMPIPESNINNTGSLTKFLGKIKTAGVPERVTFEFLKTLGFKSSNDRPIITIMRGIGFLDSNGAPTERYKSYRSNDGGRVLANALRDAYSDIFLAHTEAQDLPLEELKGIIASKSTKGEPTVLRIARTFQTLAKAADFTNDSAAEKTDNEEIEDASETTRQDPIPKPPPPPIPAISQQQPSFHYNIEIHLPTTTDITVYNAIFKSLKENLL